MGSSELMTVLRKQHTTDSVMIRETASDACTAAHSSDSQIAHLTTIDPFSRSALFVAKYRRGRTLPPALEPP